MSSVILEKKPLPASVSYTQDMQDRFGYNDPVGAVRGEAYSDKAGTIYLEESDDAGTSWTQTATITVNAGVTTSLPWTKLTKRWFRFRYVNGAVAQGSFILLQQVEGLGFALPSSSGALTTQLTGSNVEAINGEDAATKSDLVAGKTVGGKQVPLNVDADGKLQVGGITVESLTATTVGIDQETENANEVVVKSGSITLTGSQMELYGASLGDRPDATTVPIGTTFTIVDDTRDFKTWMSNGVDWGEEI